MNDMFDHETNKGYGNSLTAPVDITSTEYAYHLLLYLCETVGTRLQNDNVKISVVSALQGETLFWAGIYLKDPDGDKFTLLTREAEGCMVGIHNRMPLILTRSDMEKWLFSQKAVRLLDRHFDKLQRKKSMQERYQKMSLF